MLGLIAAATALASDVSICAPPEPASAEGWRDHAFCLTMTYGDPREVFEAYGRALALDPDLIDARAGQINLAAHHELPEAEALWLACRDESITDVALRGARAQLAAQQGEWERAREDLDAVVAEHPDAASARLQRAVAARCSGDASLALADARRVIPVFRDHRRLRACWVVADLEVAAGRPESARDQLRQGACRADRVVSTASLPSLLAELEARIGETFGSRGQMACGDHAPDPAGGAR